MKKLDKLVIKAFIGPFLATFFITLSVLVMQFFWLWIDEFVGKGLPASLILEFIWYQAAALVPLALPLAVLLSSLMTFGNLGESYELVAVKSAGISLLRFMRPLAVLVIMICGLAFFVGNNVVPVANLKSRTMLGDIVYAKPAFDVKEGVFYTRMQGMAIKVGKKVSDTIIQDVVIYEVAPAQQDNFITATDGIMRVTPDKRYLEFELHNGWRYQERSNPGSNTTEYVRLGFKQYKKQIDMSEFALRRSEDSLNKGNWKMKNLVQLGHDIDSLEKVAGNADQRVHVEVFTGNTFSQLIDTPWKTAAKPAAKMYTSLIPDTFATTVHQRAASRASSMYTASENLLAILGTQEYEIRRHEIEWHRKIMMALACFVLFCVGAPLGAIIRRGGVGTSMIWAIGFFMLFYFTSNTGEKFAKTGAWTPTQGMWLSTAILLPFGAFLTYKAVRDSQLFNKEYYTKFLRRLRALLPHRGMDSD